VYTSAGWTQVPTYARAALGVGNTLIGPALIDSTQTTLYLDGGWRLEVDVYDNLQITRAVQ
jgi:N-methylhydantoinase A